jgi:hypothetical protein
MPHVGPARLVGWLAWDRRREAAAGPALLGSTGSSSGAH